jgi:hypothetical protein
VAGSSGQGLSNCAGGLGGQSARAQRASEVAGSAPQPSPAKPPDAGRQAGTFSQVDCSLPNIPSSLPNIPRQADCPPARPPTVVADRGGNVCGHLGGADLGVQVLNAQTRQLRELAQRGVHVVHVRLQGAQGGVDGWQRQGRGRAWKGGALVLRRGKGRAAGKHRRQGPDARFICTAADLVVLCVVDGHGGGVHKRLQGGRGDGAGR